ncbi:MAG: helix-turn-helix domain-containing protein [Lewinellaceae bacterium]|nr:helix-turn-helix domain-containing protein [Lewinellaceae bacterium]
MGQAKTLDIRQRVVTMKQSKHTNASISESLQIGIGTVKNIWKRYQTNGKAGLPACYDRCGRPVSPKEELAFRLVRLVRHIHPTWGVPLIVLKVSEKFPELKLRSIRQYQRRLFEGRGQLPRPILPPKPDAEQSRIAHDTWQIDAKERFYYPKWPGGMLPDYNG